MDIFEASDRVGGRCWSKKFTNADGSKSNTFAEMGAMRIPLSQKTFWTYVDEFGLKSGAKFPDPGKVLTRFFYANKTYDWSPGLVPPGPFKKIAEDFSKWVLELQQSLYLPFYSWQQNRFPSSFFILRTLVF